ncbi:hypothetical protein EG68_05348 [Paragonimus skrjabini miyazakii]|uniref:UBA domain-containing protein n=1 Tax=Paragonimus skrjabini miyazakii TaxID=59628 RepID=A0A8S9YZH2_9TREM|nr:hypothetical protein EG68_05348 [Paragonimus skrjabini miyazakii]
MDRHSKSPFQPWSSSMVTEIDIICRSKIPVVPDLIADPCFERSVSNFEYDFIHERQIVADHDQYWDQKRRMDCTSPTSLPDVINQPVSPRANSDSSASPRQPRHELCTPVPDCSTKLVLPEPAAVHLPQSSVKSCALTSATQLALAPPMSARQLVTGQVLQPRKTEVKPDSKETETCNSANMLDKPSPSENVAGESRICIRDFDSGPDDPFASMELNTINELEELKNVLLTKSTVNGPLTPAQTSLGSWTAFPQTNPNFASPSLSSLVTASSSHTSTSPLAPKFANEISDRLITPAPFAASHFPAAVQPSGPSASGLCTKTGSNLVAHADYSSGPLAVPGKTLSSSVPNLEVLGTIEAKQRPSSVTGSTTHLVHRPSPTKAHPLVGGPPSIRQTRTSSRSPARTTDYTQSLIQWAKDCGYSESVARNLLLMQRNKSLYFNVPLETARQHLLSQLRVVNLLLKEYRPPHYPNNLSEQSAIVAATSFSHDLAKARQFAQVVLDLERVGYSQETAQSFLLDSSLNQEITLAQLMSALPRPPPVVRRTLPLRKTVWPSQPSLRQPKPT